MSQQQIIKLLTLLLVTITTKVNAQLNINAPGVTLKQIIDTVEGTSPELNDTSEGGSLRRFNAAKTFWSARVSHNDSSGDNMFKQYRSALSSAVHAKYAGPCSGSGQFQGAWQCTGPDELDMQAMGYVECIWADPDDPDHLLAGTNGGLFKTTNGGATWECISDNAPISKGIGGMISSIAVHPTNKDIIYLGTKSVFDLNNRILSVWGLFGASLLKTTDGGTTWCQEIVGTSGNEIDHIQKVYFTPDGSHLIVLKNRDIFIGSINSNCNNCTCTSWQEITNSTLTSNPLHLHSGAIWRDLEFVPGDVNANNHFFIASSHSELYAPTAGGVFEVTKTGSTWNINSIITMGSANNTLGADYCLRAELSIPDATNLFAVFVDPYKLIARYELSTGQWFVVKSNPNFDLDWIKAEFVVSPEKVQAIQNGPFNYNMYAGGKNIWQSYDGGQIFNDLGNYWGPNTHADVRSISLQIATPSLLGVNDRVLFATDGGVALKPVGNDHSANGHFTCIDISGKGLTATTFWGLSTSEDGGRITAGAQHQGIFSYEPTATPKWVVPPRGVGGDSYADGATTVFDQSNKKMSWATGWGTGHYYKSSGGGGRDINVWNWESGFPSENAMPFAIPLFADRIANSQYAGQTNLRRKLDGTTTWQFLSGSGSTFGLNNFPGITYIRDFAFSPNEGPDPIGYVIFQKVGTTPPTNSLQLWRRLPTSPNFPNFDMVTAPTNSWYQMNDIALDPNNVERVWVSMGSLTNSNPTRTKDRVFYSINGGDDWHDVSKGLPDMMPVTNIVFQEGTNNAYCATDVGIFKCDFTNFDPNQTSNGINNSVEWICFNKLKQTSTSEFPMVYVTGMEINYCSGKLYTATYGRGIWETNILVDPYPANNPPTYMDEFRPAPQEMINSNTTWSTDKYLTTGVKITNNATLTISGSGTTIHMPANGVILVDRGATLVVDGATITNSCEKCMWAGINLGGTAWQSQGSANSHPHQGRVVLQNGATLEHARTAISNWSLDDPAGHATSGGIIHATGANFINNGRSAEFIPYQNYGFGGIPISDGSFFRNCTFNITNDYKGLAVNYPFKHHVTMWDVSGVKFYGNTFKNEHTGNLRGLGDGIYSYNSGFNATRYPLNLSQSANAFLDLKQGISIDGDMRGKPKSVLIDRNDFDGTTIGIMISNVENVTAIRNSFSVGNGRGIELLDCHDNIGIYATNTAQFRIEENVFTESTPKTADYTIGTLIHHSGGNDKELYKNSYNGLDYGILATGKNRVPYIATYPAGNTGLRILCNSFTGNTNDVGVSGNNTAPNYEGIAMFQGSNALSAGNRFNTSTSTHFNNTASSITYYYGPNNSNVIPSNFLPAPP